MRKIIYSFFLLLFTSSSIASEISIVDINYLLKNSNKGKSIQKELDNLNSKNFKKFKEKKKIIRDWRKKSSFKKKYFI